MALAPAVVPEVASQHLLFVDTDPVTRRCAQADVGGFRSVITPTIDGARRILSQFAIAGMVTDAVLSDGSGIELCRSTKASSRATSVLIMTADPECAPDAIDAGCDGVLLKPFSPNLLFARLGRLLRARGPDVRQIGHHNRWQAGSPTPRPLARTTNQYWSKDSCPHCQHLGVTGFEFSDHRRAWYACLACRKVWTARRHE
jgi:DNA-binding response OmpR family regulator